MTREFAEQPSDGFVEHLAPALELRCSGRLLAGGHSDFQNWEVWDTAAFGRLYRLDGRSMASERDSFLCHEPLVHIAGLAHPEPRHALILGGGDGASAAELLKHPRMQEIVIAELDPAVVQLTREFLPDLHDGALDSPQVTLNFGDAAAYVRSWQPEEGSFDLIVFDLTDPDTAAAPLFSVDFFRACKRLLNKQGALSLHLGSPLWQREQVEALLGHLREVFALVTPCFPTIPLYGGLWSMAVASDALDPTALPGSTLAPRIEGLLGNLRLIDASQYHALLACPPWLEQFEGF
ncbi:polyamine aminopropyltransferase [Uliginosibacterium sp. 31-16]|uniref:spermine/spermidine synthase domain-containing protein n=1 Tax=Uliginosibacterium sp. 31-16 TaxID=3068315 RepID=UPI00273F61D1|nr:polyamine aminopropyltransferase [Uliginosibacterium sp. 31-16]MDP5238882.1 polyamine aminopropyltransferase [Uliginosibacterium sp. 31-16]